MGKTKKKKRNVIFLDVDGVLNDRYTEDRTPCGFIGLEDSMIANLAFIVEKTGAEIVLTSTWKSEWKPHMKDCEPDGAYLSKRLKKHSLRIIDKTEDHTADRGAGIKQYLDEHPDIENWVVLDDDDLIAHSVSASVTQVRVKQGPSPCSVSTSILPL